MRAIFGRKNRTKVLVAALIALMLFFRLANIHMQPLTHVNVHGDEGRVLTIAKNVAERGVYAYSEGKTAYETSPVNAFWTGPLTVYTYALSFSLFGANYIVARATSVFFGLVSVLLFCLIARKLYGKRAAIICLAMAGLDPVIVFYSKLALHDTLCYMFFLAAVYLALGVKKNAYMRMFLMGAFAGLATISRYNGLIILPPLIIYFAWTRRWRFARELPFMLAGTAIVFAAFYAWLAANGFTGLFAATIMMDVFEAGVMAQVGVLSVQGAGALLGIIGRYLPFIALSMTAGMLLVWKRGLAGKRELLIVLWMLISLAWWAQSSATAKYAMAFMFPGIIFASGALSRMYREPAAIRWGKGRKPAVNVSLGKRSVILFLLLAVAFYAAVNAEAVYDMRDVSEYATGDFIRDSDERVLFAEAPLSFVSGKSIITNYWNDTYNQWIDESARPEMLYTPQNNHSIHDFFKAEKPRYVMLSEKFGMRKGSPRRELAYYAQTYGRASVSFGSYTLYELDWDRPVNATFSITASAEGAP